MKQFLQFLSPRRAFRDLRGFLSARRPHELLFAVPALILTSLVVLGFYKDSRVEVPYKPNIIYVESWPLNRSDEEIRAQQKIDQVKKHALQAEAARQAKERQQKFKEMDDWLSNRGI